MPGPLIWTRVLLYRPVVTATRRVESPVTTCRANPPPDRASSAFTGAASTLSARCEVMLTFTGASSRLAPGGVASSVMVTVTVAGELLPPPPLLPADAHGDWPGAPPPPPAVPVPLPPGQVATVPTVCTWPPTVELPSGSTTDTASAGLTRYSWSTGRSTVTSGVMPVAVSTVPPPPPPPAPLPPSTEPPSDGV